MKYDLAVDLGTANVVIYISGFGIVLREPTVAAVTTDRKRKVIAVGEKAVRMLGKTIDGVELVRPLKDGVIADFRITEAMLKMFVKKALDGKNASKRGHTMVICVPCNINTIEHETVKDAAKRAGASTAIIAKEPIAAAIGAGLEIQEPIGHMLVDIGGGTSDIAIFSMGGLIAAKSIRCGGVKMDEDIVNYVRKTYNMIIGDKTAERIKMEIGCAIPDLNQKSMTIRGRDNVSGMPMSAEITSREIYLAISSTINKIIDGIISVLQQCPPEILSDIMENGILLAGGGNLLEGMEIRVKEEIGLKTYIAENPMDCVAMGAGIIAQNRNKSKKRRK